VFTLLSVSLQDEIHDSIEDAKTSLLLYRKYKSLAAEGPERVSAVLQDLYAYGNRNNWTIGLDKLNAQP
jgi:PAB-dependent poly(A)-specific ribonuclease subunit 2